MEPITQLVEEYLPTKTYLEKPRWETVRPIYKKLSDEFHILTSAYYINLDDKSKRMLDHLIIAIDRLDACIDDLPTRKERDLVSTSVLDYLINEKQHWECTLVSGELIGIMMKIKSIVRELGIVDRFSTAASIIFKNTETKRHTADRQELLTLIMNEGRATSELPLSFMQVEANHDFARFFSKLCMLMGIADLIVDARDDYRSCSISVVPGAKLYFHLNVILIREGLRLLWVFPKKISFLGYCIRFSWALITGK